MFGNSDKGLYDDREQARAAKKKREEDEENRLRDEWTNDKDTCKRSVTCSVHFCALWGCSTLLARRPTLEPSPPVSQAEIPIAAEGAEEAE